LPIEAQLLRSESIRRSAYGRPVQTVIRLRHELEQITAGRAYGNNCDGIERRWLAKTARGFSNRRTANLGSDRPEGWIVSLSSDSMPRYCAANKLITGYLQLETEEIDLRLLGKIASSLDSQLSAAFASIPFREAIRAS
jgi:hypothetical protein